MKLYFLIFLVVVASNQEKKYVRNYYENSRLKEEGWMLASLRTDYWYFYHPNGSVKEKGSFKLDQRESYWYSYTEAGEKINEGHYKTGLQTGWWIFYLEKNQVLKAEFANGKKNGYAFYYSKNDLYKAEKYVEGVKEGEWTSYESFKRDN